MIGITSSGSFNNILSSLKKEAEIGMVNNLDRFAKMGVDALAAATPVDTGLTAASWSYRIGMTPGGISIVWYNTNTSTGVNVAVIRQYGHGTGTGGWVEGIDYINPAITSVYDEVISELGRG